MPNHYIFTLASLQACLERAPNDEWFASFHVPDDGSWGVLAAEVNQCTVVIHRDDKPGSPRIIVIAQDDTPSSPVPVGTLRPMFQRIHRVALGVANPPLHLPPAWSEFRHQNLLAFFATPHGLGALSLRWIVEIRPDNSDDICFWKLTGPTDALRLDEYKPPYDLYRTIVGYWKSALPTISQRFAELPAPPTAVTLEPAIDLEATTFGPVTQYRTFSMWLEHLTPKQLKFVNRRSDHSLKLKGPAGSGKTLALVLKALRELYSARDAGREIRLLFATHSWTVAEQIDAALRRLDETGDISEIDVFPLLEIARSNLPAERQPGRGFTLLGEDSLSGRRLQLRRIDEIVDHLAKSDWLTYRRQVSRQFQARVQAQRGSAERNALVWDLMMEFSSVLSAHGILPGVNAERRYLALQRSLWMMLLETPAEKRFVLRVYTDYVDALKRERLLTSDQLVNDFLNYLETFTWNLRREQAGYDLILVDELHLFTEQERLVLHYLTRSAAEYPKMFMALDPRQSPSEVYAEFPIATVAGGESGRADLDLGTVASVELSKIHRFSPEILALVQHIHRRYPALELGRDWETDIDSVESEARHGDRPLLLHHSTETEEIATLVKRLEDFWDAVGSHRRIAVIFLDSLKFAIYQQPLEEGTKIRLCTIQSRDDVDTLRYSRRSVAVGPAEYLAGLQFDYVLIAGMPNMQVGVANLGYQQRRLLTLLYLAVSRATTHVEIHVNDENGGIPNILETALAAGVLQRVEVGQGLEG